MKQKFTSEQLEAAARRVLIRWAHAERGCKDEAFEAAVREEAAALGCSEEALRKEADALERRTDGPARNWEWAE